MSEFMRAFLHTIAAAVVSMQAITAPALPADPALTAAITQLMADPAIAAASVGLVVTDADSGLELFTKAPDAPLVPASNMKTVTTLAALATFGPTKTLPTKVYTDAVTAGATPHLYLKGFGDPTLSEADLNAMAAKVKADGITSVGALVADATFFDDVRYHPGWLPEHFAQRDLAQVSALTMTPDADGNAGSVGIVWAGGAKTGAPAVMTVVPAAASGYITIDNKATTGPRTTIVIKRADPNVNTFTTEGKVRVGVTSGIEAFSVNNPALYTATVFAAALRANGVRVSGAPTLGATPSSATLQQTHESCPMTCVVHNIMKLSNNTQAEQLFKALGASSGGQGTWASGTTAVTSVLTQAGVDTSKLTIADGCGEAYADQLTPRALAQLLVWARKQPWYQAWYDALPVAGDNDKLIGGTLKGRFVGTPAAGNLRAKTGTLSDAFGVTSLAGYVTGADGRHYAFALISNYPKTNPREATDKVFVLLAGWKRPV